MKRNKDGTLHAHSHAYQRELNNQMPRWVGERNQVDAYYVHHFANALDWLHLRRDDYAAHFDVRDLDTAIASLQLALRNMQKRIGAPNST